MAEAFNRNTTILAYLDILESYADLTNNERPTCVGLNKGEWVQFLNLVNANFNMCRAHTEIDTENGGHGKYKDIFIFWTGSEDILSYYRDDLSRLRHEIDRLTQTITTPAQEALGRIEPQGYAPRMRGRLTGTTVTPINEMPQAIHNAYLNTPVINTLNQNF